MTNTTGTENNKKVKNTKKEENNIETIDAENIDADSGGVDDEKYESYDDIHKAIVELDKEILNLHRRRILLQKQSFKLYNKEKRKSSKKTKKINNNVSDDRKTSGFNKPKLVPDSICKYLGLDIGTILPRTRITSQLYAKLKEEKLLDIEDQRKIIPNDEVRSLFMMQENEVIKFESFQHYVARVYSAFSASNVQAQETEEPLESETVA